MSSEQTVPGNGVTGSETHSKQMVETLKEKDQVRSIFLVSEKQVLVDRNGKSYMSVSLSDSSGSVNARIWEKVDSVSTAFESGDFVQVKGHVQVYQNRKQIVVHDIKRVDLGDYDLKDFVPQAKVDPAVLYDDVLALASAVKNPHIRQLLELVLKDEDLKPLLLRSPAAKTIHHAYMGGLLDHILSICKIMQSLAAHYDFLELDYLIFGAIFHDIGKIEELTFEDGIKYSDKGRLVGHMGIACDYIDKKSQRILGFPEELRDLLKHIVLSHHGRLEYGSPRLPMFPEAVVVAMVDDLDSKMNTMVEFMKSELNTSERWSRYHQGFDRYFFLEILRNKIT